MTLDFASPCGKCVLSFEDDGKVAYAYLKKEDVIVGDIWIYNRCSAPPSSEWDDRGNIPFANCQGFVGPGAQVRAVVAKDDVKIDWETDENGPVAYVYIFEDLFGVVGVGDKPGCARHALKDGPLAKVMEIE